MQPGCRRELNPVLTSVGLASRGAVTFGGAYLSGRSDGHLTIPCLHENRVRAASCYCSCRRWLLPIPRLGFLREVLASSGPQRVFFLCVCVCNQRHCLKPASLSQW